MKSFSFVRNTLVVLALLTASCGSDSGASAPQPPEPNEPLALTATAAPFDIGSAEFYEGISYGPHDENLFDIYIPESDEPTPLLIWIHGGGFTGGSRDTEGLEANVLTYLAEGVAYASIDYRLLQSPDPAGTALWIAFNDEMADPTSEDPVEQHSTRVTAAIAIATQATYDIGKWKTVVFEEYGLDLLMLADALGLSQALLDFYGITDIDDFESPAIMDYRAEVDMLDAMDPDDPPFYAQNDLEPAGPTAPPLSVNLAFHHANHALVLQEKADEIGLENVIYMKGLMVEDPSGEDAVDFGLRHFGL